MIDFHKLLLNTSACSSLLGPAAEPEDDVLICFGFVATDSCEKRRDWIRNNDVLMNTQTQILRGTKCSDHQSVLALIANRR